jgi:XisI protein
MDTVIALDHTLTELQRILEEYCDSLNRHANGSQCKLIINHDRTRYLVIDEGWINHKRIHALIFDAEIRSHKIWLHHDGLDHGITDDLIAAGIPKDQIVLAFHPADIRPHTGYAIA